MDLILTLLSWILLLAGGAFLLIGGVGVLRMPDFYTRVHAASLVDTMGAGLMILGLMLQAGLSLVSVKLVLILVFLLLTGPVATHALASAALGGGLRPKLAEDRTDGAWTEGKLNAFSAALGDDPSAKPAAPGPGAQAAPGDSGETTP